MTERGGGGCLSISPSSPSPESQIQLRSSPLGYSLVRERPLTFSFLTASFTTSVPFGASTSVFPRNCKEKKKKERKRFNAHPSDMPRWLKLNNLSSSGRGMLRLDVMMSIFIQSSKHRETSFEQVILPISNRWSH